MHFTNAQTNTVVPDFKKDIFYSIKDFSFYKDPSFKKPFNKIKQTEFGSIPKKITNFNNKFWFKFKVSNPLKSKLFSVLLNSEDKFEVYIPTKNGYKIFKKGLFVKGEPIKNTLGEKLITTYYTDSIDFTKPFYLSKTMLTIYGKTGFLKAPKILFTDNQFVIDGMLQKNNNTSKITHYSIIFLFSFILFFVSFLVTKDKNYLNYSFYIFFILLIFGVHIPLIYNSLNYIHPHIYFYLEDLSQIISSGFYFYFVMHFLDFKTKFPKLYQFSIYLLSSFVFLSILIFALNIFYPHSTFRFYVFDAYRIVFTIVSLSVFIYLMTKKLDLTSKIVLLGSLLLIVGNFLTLLLNDSRIFLMNAVAEIILFSMVISIKNKLTFKENATNQIALEIEKNKRISLEELNNLKTNFLANITHEFRTPLTLISGPIQKQLKRKNLLESDKKNFNLIKRNSDRLLQLVDQLLSFSKLESGQVKLEVTNNKIQDFLNRILNNFNFLAQKKEIIFYASIRIKQENLWFSKDVLEKILSNLLSNAVKYTTKKGIINVSVSQTEEVLSIIIENTIENISNIDLQAIFKRFYQIDTNTEGVGIGLSYVKELVKLHNGTITVEKSADDKILFKLQIPISKNSYLSNQIKEVNIQEKEILKASIKKDLINTTKSEHPHLLIVEDNTDIQQYIADLFKDEFIIHFSNNGKDGIKKAMKIIPDIILSDIMMPIKSGIDLCNVLKNNEKTYHIPILLITAKVGDDNKIAGLKSGADDYIEKPFNNELLKLKVANLLNNIKKLQERFSQEIILKPSEVAISSVDELFLQKIQDIIDNDLINSSFNSSIFSKKLLMSRMQLHRKLKSLFGLTTTEFIHTQRLKTAIELLKKDTLSVAEIAYSVGFNNPAYFSKKFKEYYHCTPTEFIKK